jgi:aldehyde:ferredoxin oxidoreductase
MEPRKKVEVVVIVAGPVLPLALLAPARLVIITRWRSPSTGPHVTQSHIGASKRTRD